MTVPGNNHLARPELPTYLPAIFDKSIEKYCGGTMPGHVYEVRIVEGFVAFKATFTKEIEIASVTYQVILHDEKNKAIREWTGTRAGEFESLDASEQSAMALLDMAYAAVFLDAITALSPANRL